VHLKQEWNSQDVKNVNSEREILQYLHDHPSSLCSPDVLSPVGDPLSGKRVWFTESHIILIISFLIVILFTQFIVDKMKKSRSVSS